MPEDWFAQNAPKASDSGADWFAQNAPPPTSETTPTAPQGSAVSRFISSAVAPIKGAVTGLYQAAATPPQTTTEKVINALGPGSMFLKRTLVDPAIEQGKEAVSELGQAAPTSMNPTQEQLWHWQKALGHGLAAIIPGLGPMAATAGEKIGEQVGTGDVAGALGTGAGNAALLVAPKVAGKVTEAVTGAAKTADALSGNGPAPKPTRSVGELIKKATKTNEDIAQKRAADVKDYYDKTHPEPAATLESGRPRTAEELQSHKAALNSGIERMDPEIRGDLETVADRVNLKANDLYDNLKETIGDNQVPAFQAVGKDGHIEGAPVPYLQHVYDNAASKITDWSNDPTLIKNLGERVKSGDSSGTWTDLQELRTKVGAELRKGTLPSDQFHAYKGMMEDIDAGMQKVADALGKTAEQNAARNYYRQYAETFLDRNSPIRKAIESSDPRERLSNLQGKMRVNDQDVDAVQAVARYDPMLARKINTVRGYQSEADAITTPKTAPYKAPAELGPKPTPKTISAEDVQKAKADTLQERAHAVMNRGYWAAAGSAIYALQDMIRGHNFNPVGAALTGTGALAAASMISKALQNPAVVDFFTKATAKDAASIPADLRGDFPAIAKAAQSHGIKLSPALTALAAGGTQQKPVAAALQTQ